MKNFIIIALILLCGYVFFFHKAPVEIKNTQIPPEVEAYVKADVEEINKKISQKGFEVAVLDEVQNNIQDIKLLRDSAKAFKDSMLNEVKLKDRQIISLTRYSASLQDSLMVASVTGDTSFKYAENGLKIELNRPKNKPAYFNYSYDANINYIQYWDKDNFFAPKKEYIDFWIEDTRASINGVKRLKIQQKQDEFKLDISASSFYIDRLNIGAEAQATMGRYQIGGGYFYDMIDKTWKPIVSAKFKLIEF